MTQKPTLAENWNRKKGSARLKNWQQWREWLKMEEPQLTTFHGYRQTVGQIQLVLFTSTTLHQWLSKHVTNRPHKKTAEIYDERRWARIPKFSSNRARLFGGRY